MPTMYYCTKCKRKHRCGKIYEDHKKYEQKNEEEIPYKKIIECDISTLRIIARRQIQRYLKRIEQNPHSEEMYNQAINRVIIYEQRNGN